jgi:hypothetical protein
MKKLFVVLMMLTMLVSLSSAQSIYNAEKFAGRIVPNGQWSEWQNIEVIVIWDFEAKRIIVKTVDPQIIDYNDLSKKRFSNHWVYSGYATDTNYLVIRLEIYLYDSGTTIIKIMYNDFEYKYRLSDL